LTEFVRRHPNDAPGIVAEYMLLWETMAKLPPAEVERREAELVRKIGALGAKPAVLKWDDFAGMPEQLRVMAAAAQGKPVTLPPDAGFGKFPHRMVPDVGDRSEVTLISRSRWAVNEWVYIPPDGPKSLKDEGRAALALLGRGNNRFIVDPAWLRDFPDSVALSSFVIRAICAANKTEGLPLRAPFDAAREKALYRQMVEYVYAQVRRQIAIASTAKELDWLENTQLREFFTELSRPGFQRTVPDEEMEAMRQTLIREMDAASARIGRSATAQGHRLMLTWKQVNRTKNCYPDPKTRRVDQEDAYDVDLMRANAASLLSESTDAALLSSTWYVHMRNRVFGTLSPDLRAELFTAALPQLRRQYLEGDLSTYDMERLLQFAATLLDGGHYEEAEEIFRRVAEVEENDVNGSRKAANLRANACLHLGALAIHFGRENEGAALLKKAIGISGDSMVRVVGDGGWNSRNYESVQSVATRLLSDLREKLSKDDVVHSVGQLRFAAKGFFPGEVTFYYRIPAGFDPASGRKYRVLLLMPSVNQDAAEYCKYGHTWARFADAHDLFLVVPQFMQFWSSPILPQEWSGDATLRALAELGKRYPISTEGMLLHGYGRGAAFLQRFALWRPDLVAAASLHSTSDWAWEESMPEGLGTLSTLRKIPLLVTSGDRDGDVNNSLAGSYANAIRFVTFARGEGLSVDWKSLPGVVHRPSPDMESFAQNFLVKHLKADPKTPATP
jgi:tetratricopeptide (TPR) repeat protein